MVTEVAMEERIITKVERGNMIAREKSLLWLMKRTANKIDDVLSEFTSLDDLNNTRMELKAVLGMLSFAEDRERSSGKKSEELGYFSIKRFKRTAITRFGEAVVLLVERENSPDLNLKADSEERCEVKLEAEAGGEGLESEVYLAEEEKLARAEEQSMARPLGSSIVLSAEQSLMTKADEVKCKPKLKAAVAGCCCHGDIAGQSQH